jgi:hypothetical protein
MSITTIPSALYKYLVPCRAAQILRDLRIRFSQASVLNDVDEFQPPYKGIATRAEIEKIVCGRIKQKLPNEYAKVYQVLPKKNADSLIDEMESKWADTVEADYEKSVREVYARLDGNFGLLSLSETVTSKLMWSFYSDGGRGFVVEFDPSHVWFSNKTADNDSFRHLRQVRYVAERKPEYLLATKDDDLLYTKTLEWKYEKEWRIIRHFTEAKEKVGPDDYGKDVWLFDMPSSAIRSVVLGYRTTSENEAALREMVSANANLKHIIFRRAVRNVDGKIEIVSDVTGIL